jgi:hypothetical protein
VSRFIFGPLATSPDLYDTLVSNLAYYELRSEVSRFLLDPSTTSPHIGGVSAFASKGTSSIRLLYHIWFVFSKPFATLELVLELPHV